MKRMSVNQTYAVGIDKYGEAIYSASSPQAARSQAWRALKLVKPDLSFNAFVKMSTVRKLKSAERAA